ncbi:hypothetical protein [Rhodonellum sp.]|uniref:hypothetical protein n=1 Tax=Rhodonellum sp. TaxID=2231180 RepID=UPI00271F8501|nr:hypothetical protein [Rhodonellum sp.]MDO9553356.1 hypothetical protein [Rhodonellum sp.]
MEIDEAMLEMSGFVSQMVDLDGLLFDLEEKVLVQLEKADLEIPIQLEILNTNDEGLKIGCSPPLYYVETTVLPVFHQLKVNIEITENKASHGDSL